MYERLGHSLNIYQVDQKAFELVFLCLQVLKQSAHKVCRECAQLCLWLLCQHSALAPRAVPDLAPAAIAVHEQVLFQGLFLNVAPARLQLPIHRLVHHDSHLAVHVAQMRLLVVRTVLGNQLFSHLRCQRRLLLILLLRQHHIEEVRHVAFVTGQF